YVVTPSWHLACSFLANPSPGTRLAAGQSIAGCLELSPVPESSMSRRPFLPALLLILVSLSACTKDGTGPSDPNTGGGPVDNDPITNGGWPNPDGTVPTVQPVDTTVYTPTDTLSPSIGDTTIA